MTEKELQTYLLKRFPKEDAGCDWKEMTNLKNSFANDLTKMSYPICQAYPIWKEDI